MKRFAVMLAVAACSSSAYAQDGFFGHFFGEDRTVKYTVAADYSQTTVSNSDSDDLPGNQNFDSDMVNLKLGIRPENFIGRLSFLTFEVNVGKGIRDDSDPDDIETDLFVGLYAVPHAVLFDAIEIAFPVGWGRTELSKDGASDSVNSVSFGGNVLIPVRLFFADMPDIRLSAGGQVYQQDSVTRIWGWNAGLRWDF